MENRRKNYFIKKEFQAKFILKFCALVALTALISASAIYLFLNRSVTTVFENSRIMIKPSTEFIIPGLILSSLVSIALAGAAAMIAVLFISHRIAGPLYKLESSLERIAEGDLSFDIYLRKGDEAGILSGVFNKSRRGLKALIENIKAEFNRLTADIDEVKKAGDRLPLEAKDIKRCVDNLEKSRAALFEKIEKFRLG